MRRDVVGKQARAIAVSFGHEDGTFEAPQELASPEQQSGLTPSLLAVDLNHDGKTDWVTVTQENQLLVYLGK